MGRAPKKLLELQKFVVPKISHCWEDIATQLHFTKQEISQMDKNFKPVPVQDCCKEMLLCWVEKDKYASASTLIRAIKEAGNAAYADDLRKEVEKKVDILSEAYLKATVARRIATVWYDVGLYLEMDSNDLSTIRQFTTPNGNRCLQMLDTWLNRSQSDASKSPTWKKMYDAMKALEMIKSAEDLEDELVKDAGIN